MSDNKLLTAALAYAAEGLYVFPMRPGTKGFFSKQSLSVKGKGKAGGFKVASRDTNVIRNWWAKWPNANIGISTGPSALVVVDIDIKDDAGGEESWTKLVTEHGVAIGDTRTSVTASGGRQKWYLWRLRTIRNSASKLAKGIDIRGIGGLVIAPPSRVTVGKHPGVYSWETDGSASINGLPGVLVQLLTEPLTTLKTPRSAKTIIETGTRDNTLTSMAGKMHRAGFGAKAILAALLLANWEKCKPPLPDSDVKRIATSVSSYDPPEGRANPTPFGNSSRFIAQHAGTVHFDHTQGRWMYWNGSYWKPDVDGEVRRLGRKTLVSIYGEAMTIDDEKARKALIRWSLLSETKRHLLEMLYLARDSVSIKVIHADLNVNPWLLHTPQGTVDLRTGKLHESNPRDMITKVTGCGPLGDSSGAWERHIRYFLPDNGTRRWVQRELGRALSGEHLAEVLNIWFGEGANGKTTTIQAIQRVLGDYCRQAAPGILVASRYDKHPTALADLWGSRVVFSEEIREGSQLAETLMKQLTGGGTIKARFMHQDFFEFDPTWDITLVVNHQPTVSAGGYATWRRLRLVPWTVTIPPERQRPMIDVVNELTADGAAILRWLLIGMDDWRTDHEWEPETVRKATNEYKDSQNILADFFGDICELGSSGPYRVTKGEFYDAYTSWCIAMGEEPISKKRIKRHMPQGIVEGRGTNGVKMWFGVKLKDPNRSVGGK